MREYLRKDNRYIFFIVYYEKNDKGNILKKLNGIFVKWIRDKKSKSNKEQQVTTSNNK